MIGWSALLMQSNLEQAGFKVTLQPDPWNRVTEQSSTIRLRDAKVFHHLTEGVP